MESPYKDALCHYVQEHNIRFLVDLHQLAAWREQDINLGTGNGKNLWTDDFLHAFVDAYKKQEIGIISINKPFSGAYPHTVSSHVRTQCGIECLQVEINSRLVYGKSADGYFERVFCALRDGIRTVNQMIDRRHE